MNLTFSASVFDASGASLNPYLANQSTHDGKACQGIIKSLEFEQTASADGAWQAPSITLVSVGNYVWIDANGDGEQNDAHHPIVGNLAVSLLDETGVVSSTTTDASGFYSFSNLIPGVYSVMVTPPTGYTVTTGGADPDTDPSDTDSNAILSGTFGVDGVAVSLPFTLTVGDEPTNDSGFSQDGVDADGNGTVDFGFVPVADVELQKFSAAATYIPGQATSIQYTVVVTNHGPADVASIVVSDTQPSGMTFESWSCTITNNAAGTLGNACAEGSGSGNINSAVTLNKGAVATFIVNTTLDASASGTVTNIAELIVPPGIVAPPGIVRPKVVPAPVQPALIESVAVEKVLNSPSPARQGETINFTIRITNTGTTTIASVPLTDTYQSTFLSFVSAVPAPDNSNDDGLLNWSNLATLAPGESVSVVVNFTAEKDTTFLPNSATINRATVLGEIDEATLQIFAPTAVELTNYVLRYQNDAIFFQWQMPNESTVAGFHLYRGDADGNWVQVTDTPIVAEASGQSQGTSYSYQDNGVLTMTHHSYRLEIISLNGDRNLFDLGAVFAGQALFLPIAVK
jgi:uncharacterized repeat protein (TIGR01451 family)